MPGIISSDQVARVLSGATPVNGISYHPNRLRLIDIRRVLVGQWQLHHTKAQHSNPVPTPITSPWPQMSIPVPSFREVLFFDRVQSAILSTLPNPSCRLSYSWFGDLDFDLTESCPQAAIKDRNHRKSINAPATVAITPTKTFQVKTSRLRLSTKEKKKVKMATVATSGFTTLTGL